MRVVIDEVEYGPIPMIPKDTTLLSALEIRFDSDAGENLTIRDYLRILLETLWREEERFSGKRPFGNSGWEHDIYAALIKAGFIGGRLDEDGYVEDYDWKQGEAYVLSLISAAFLGIDTSGDQS